MKKHPLSIAPWSLILSLYLLPTQPSFAQETDDSEVPPSDESTEISDTETTVESAESSEDGSIDDDNSAEEVDSATESSVVNSVGNDEEGFDPQHQLASADGLLAPTVQDIAAFKQSYKRYRNRINEFREETLSMVEIQRQEAFDLLREQYTEPVSKLKEQQLQQRSTAIERFERFIEKYPKSPEGAGIRFQLADIYFKIAEETFIEAQEEIAMKMDENPDLELSVSKDLSRAFELYQEIVELFPESDVVDGALYMMGWCYSDAESDLYDADKSAAHYKRVIEEHAESKFVPQASYFVGQYYFNLNDNDTALKYFDAATRLSKPGPGEFNALYEYANYRLAWTHYLLNEYEKALELFTLHQDYSQRKLKETGTPSNTLEESFEYTALSFADMAELEIDSLLMLPRNIMKK
jgi:tetratricopeptide (TPR) repeat protein